MDEQQPVPPRFDETFRAQLESLFAWRRDVRRFKPDAIPDDLLARLVRATRYAPSVGYSQPTRYVTVCDAARRAAIVAEFERCNANAAATYSGDTQAAYARLKLAGLREAPVHLAVYADTSTARGRNLGKTTMPEMLAYSTVTAVHTFWLFARAYGIGVGWVSILEPTVVNAILDVPESFALIAYLCVGYPVEEHLDRELERHAWESADARSTEILIR